MGTKSSIGCMMSNGKIAYVECRFDGYLAHVGRILVKRYNDFDKVLELLLGGDILALRDDPKRIERISPLSYDDLEDCEVKEANDMHDYLLNGNGMYKYLYDMGRWYVVDGLCDLDGITPIQRPMLVNKALEMGYW